MGATCAVAFAMYIHHFGYSKIRQFNIPVIVEEDILWLNIA
jgi:hypothetical protein